MSTAMDTLIALYFSVVHRSYFGLHLLFGLPFCIPFKRVKQLRATANGFESVSPSTWNLLVYGPPLDQTLNDIDKVTLFYNKFRDVGRVIYNEYAGDNWANDLDHFEECKGKL